MTDPLAHSTRHAPGSLAPVGRPHPETHPNSLLAVARLHGLATPPRETISMLELGCGDGANLLPIAAAYPGGRFVGVDHAPGSLASARTAADGIGVRHVRLLEADLRAFPADLGRFDVVVAHGLYSSSPPDVREALMRVIASHLAPGGVACLGFDALPGGWLRRIGWDAMQFHVREAKDPAERAARAREFIALLAETWKDQPGTGAALAEVFAHEAGRDDAAILHDDLSPQNEPAYVSAVASHARRFGLALIGDVDPGVRSFGTAGPALRERLTARHPQVREQMLDFVHLRATRRSLLVHASAGLDPAPNLEGLHFAATPACLQRRDTRGARDDVVGELLAAAHPASVSMETLRDGLRSRGLAEAEARSRLHAAWARGVAEPFVDALAIARLPSDRPRASAVARWQATRQPLVTNLRHVGVPLADDFARAVLARCDGTRTVAGIAAETRSSLPAAESGDPSLAVERRLARLASDALLEA